ncbi:MAG TPA: PD-(D/E)XK nuclease family protein, partial [Beutenbergiaceae bacterium]|nr:PD-(D/E)XK nuclease family protein [Beutenbergiaceae bacterium]
HRQLQEERRLAYVAFTRAKTSLLLTGSFWRPQVTSPATPSIFLTETTRAVDEIPRPPLAPDAQDNPLADAGQEVMWPTETSTHPPESSNLTHGEVSPPTQQEIQQWFDMAELLLAEREQQGKPQDVAIEYLSASNVVQAVKDPHGFVANRRRPLPQQPSLHARQGTEFHAWVEQHFHTPTLVDWDAFSGADEDQQDEADLQRLKDTFLASEWANQKPVGLEVEVETTIAGRRIRSRIDAVFFDGQNYHVVDWKTGRPPTQISRDHTSTVQLQVYRLAWARAQDISVDNVGASYYYVANDMTIQAPNLGEEEIVEFVATHLNRLEANPD